MTNEQRDKKINEIHTAVTVIAGKVEEHHNTLYGNGRPGLAADMILLQNRQNECPARKAASSDGKRLNIAYVMMSVGIIGLLFTIAVQIAGWFK